MLNTPFSSWPSFSVEEADAVARVLLSNRVNYWTGEECRAFEAEFAAWTGTRHAVALANGTLALEACLKAFDIGPGDEVIVTPRTFLLDKPGSRVYISSVRFSTSAHLLRCASVADRPLEQEHSRFGGARAPRRSG